MNNLASVLMTLRQRERAITIFRRAVSMAEELYPARRSPAGHPSLAMAYDNLGMTMILLGRLDQGQEFVNRARDMRERLSEHGATVTRTWRPA